VAAHLASASPGTTKCSDLKEELIINGRILNNNSDENTSKSKSEIIGARKNIKNE
jgi:hypothetical protein